MMTADPRAVACPPTVGPARAGKQHAIADEDRATHTRDELASDGPDFETVPLRPVTAHGRHRRPGPQENGRAPSKSWVSVEPLQAWRIEPNYGRSLAARYATPWDQDAGAAYTSPDEARNILRAWQRGGTVVRDPQPTLYVYEQTGPRGSMRGLLGAVRLDSTLLPYQETVPARVEGIAELMRVGGMNLDPVLLGYPGDGRTAARLDEAARRAPLTEVLATDGQAHRLWPITAPGAYRDITAELGTRAALIADGHHRRAAARQLRRERLAAGYGPGPWDCVSGLLVDIGRTALQLRPVHRVLPWTDPWRALQAAGQQFRVTRLPGDFRQWVGELTRQAARGPAFIVAAAEGAFLLTDPDPRLISGTLRYWPAPLHGLHLAVLHAALIEAVWQTPAVPPHVHFEASATRALRQVREHGGIAVLLTAPAQRDLHTAAREGVQLPPKAASFGPPPHPGLVLRTLDTGAS